MDQACIGFGGIPELSTHGRGLMRFQHLTPA
jgi:hypothetical protein